MKELKTLKEVLKNNQYSCVVGDGQKILYTSRERGVNPLLAFYHDHMEVPGPCYVADKIIGKGAAFLLILMSIKGLYTPVISQSAMDLLVKYSIPIEYDKVVPYIINRTGEGRCPIESAVIHEKDPAKAYEKIILKLKELTG